MGLFGEHGEKEEEKEQEEEEEKEETWGREKIQTHFLIYLWRNTISAYRVQVI